jgi:hypothetical protein
VADDYKNTASVPFTLPSDVCMTFCPHVSAASAGIRCKYRNNADNPFILPSTLITFQPFLLAADLSIKLHVAGRWLCADLRVIVRTSDPLASFPTCSTVRFWCAGSTPACRSGRPERAPCCASQ